MPRLRRQPRESAPPEFAARIRAQCRQAERRAALRPWVVAPALSVAAMLLVLVMLPGVMRSGPSDAGIVENLVDKHIAYSQMERPAEFASGAHPEVEEWFRQRVGLRVTVPDYSPAGIRLVGGRIAEAGEHRAAYVLYQKGQVLLSVFMVSEPGRGPTLRGSPTSYRGHDYVTQQRKGYRTVSWSEGPAVFSMVSMLDYDAILECADSLRAQRQREARL